MNNLEAGGISRLSTPDGESYIRVTDQSETDGLLRTDIDMSWVRGETDFRWAQEAILKQLPSNNMTPDQMYFLTFYGDVGTWQWFRGYAETKPIVRSLGYSATEEVIESSPTKKRRIVQATAPSRSTWQELADRSNEQTDSELSYGTFPGAIYAPSLAMRAYVESGMVFVADKRPHIIHDLGQHPIGYFVMGETLRGEVRRQTEGALEREIVEDSLPAIGVNGDPFPAKLVEDFMRPARAFLKMFWQRLDKFSNEAVDALLMTAGVDQARKILMRRVQDVFEPYTNVPPDGLLNVIDTNLTQRVTEEIIERYKLLGNIASELNLLETVSA